MQSKSQSTQNQNENTYSNYLIKKLPNFIIIGLGFYFIPLATPTLLSLVLSAIVLGFVFNLIISPIIQAIQKTPVDSYKKKISRLLLNILFYAAIFGGALFFAAPAPFLWVSAFSLIQTVTLDYTNTDMISKRSNSIFLGLGLIGLFAGGPVYFLPSLAISVLCSSKALKNWLTQVWHMHSESFVEKMLNPTAAPRQLINNLPLAIGLGFSGIGFLTFSLPLVPATSLFLLISFCNITYGFPPLIALQQRCTKFWEKAFGITPKESNLEQDSQKHSCPLRKEKP